MIDYLLGVISIIFGLYLLYQGKTRPLYNERRKGHDTFERLWYDIKAVFAGIGFIILGVLTIYYGLATLYFTK